ncbi:MAG: hypothetical protein ACK5XN_37630 [Bacteroidota bacterium]
MNIHEGIVFSLFKLNFFFIKNRLFNFQVTPEISTTFFDGFAEIFRKLSVGFKIETNYYTQQNINIKLITNIKFNVLNLFKSIKKKEEEVSNIDLKLSFNYKGFSYILEIDKMENKTLKIFEIFDSKFYHRNKNSFLDEDSSLDNVFITGFEFDKKLESESLQNINGGLKYYYPVGKKISKEHGININFDYTTSYNFLNNVEIFKTLFSITPLISKYTLVQNNRNYRTPGIDKEYIGDFFFMNRFLVMNEIWDSSSVVAKIFSLYIGLVFQVGFLNYFDSYNSYKLNVKTWRFLTNVGVILCFDLMGVFSLFISFTIDNKGRIIFDFGIIQNTNPFTKEQIMTLS